MKAHRVYDCEDPERVIAWVHSASPEIVKLVAEAKVEGDDGRSPFMWIRLPNGDLILGVYPQGDTYCACELDAQFPVELP